MPTNTRRHTPQEKVTLNPRRVAVKRRKVRRWVANATPEDAKNILENTKRVLYTGEPMELSPRMPLRKLKRQGYVGLYKEIIVDENGKEIPS